MTIDYTRYAIQVTRDGDVHFHAPVDAVPLLFIKRKDALEYKNGMVAQGSKVKVVKVKVTVECVA